MPSWIHNIKFIFMPSYWLMNDSYDPVWDKELLQLMEVYDFEKGIVEYKMANHTYHHDSSRYKALLGDTLIWIKNHPYASFIKQGDFLSSRSGRPSRQTIYLAHKKLKKDQKFWYLTQSEKREIKLKEILEA